MQWPCMPPWQGLKARRWKATLLRFRRVRASLLATSKRKPPPLHEQNFAMEQTITLDTFTLTYLKQYICLSSSLLPSLVAGSLGSMKLHLVDKNGATCWWQTACDRSIRFKAEHPRCRCYSMQRTKWTVGIFWRSSCLCELAMQSLEHLPVWPSRPSSNPWAQPVSGL